MAQKLAPAKKIAEIYLQYLQLFASLCLILIIFALRDFIFYEGGDGTKPMRIQADLFRIQIGEESWTLLRRP